MTEGVIEGVTAKEAALLLGVTEGAIYLRKKALGAFRTPNGWMFDRRLVEEARAAKADRANHAVPSGPLDPQVSSKVFAALDGGMSPTDIVKNLVLSPDIVKQALVAYHDLRSQMLFTGAQVDRLARLGIGIATTTKPEVVIAQIEALAQSTQPCISCHARMPTLCTTCSNASGAVRRAR